MAEHGKHNDRQELPENKMGDLSERLKDLSGRIAAEVDEFKESQKQPERSESVHGYAKGLQLLAEFAAGPIVGGLIGYGLDRLFNLRVPILMIVFLLLGFGAGILNLARAGRKIPPAQERLKSTSADGGFKKEDDRG